MFALRTGKTAVAQTCQTQPPQFETRSSAGATAVRSPPPCLLSMGGHVLKKVLWHPAHLLYMTIHRDGGGGSCSLKGVTSSPLNIHDHPRRVGWGSCPPKGVVTSKLFLNHKMAALPKTTWCSDHKFYGLRRIRNKMHRWFPTCNTWTMCGRNCHISCKSSVVYAHKAAKSVVNGPRALIGWNVLTPEQHRRAWILRLCFDECVLWAECEFKAEFIERAHLDRQWWCSNAMTDLSEVHLILGSRVLNLRYLSIPALSMQFTSNE